jgi:transposase
MRKLERESKLLAATSSGRATAATWSGPGRGCASCRGDAHNGIAVERTAGSRRHGGAEEPPTRSSLGPRRCAAARVDASPDGGRARGGLCYGSVDVAAGGRTDQASLYPLVQREPGLAHPYLSRLFLPATFWTRARTRRGGDQALEANALAGTKKNAAKQGRIIVFIDESGLSERPTRVRTWAPKGQTPILQHHFNWSQLSVIAGITFRRFYFRLFPGAIKGPQIIEFLHALGQQIRQPLLVIWDGLAAHRSSLVRDSLEALNGAVQIEQLPAYAPELNPTEYIWGHLKHHELANRCAADFHDLKSGARNRLRSMQRRPTLIRAFWQQAELQF